MSKRGGSHNLLYISSFKQAQRIGGVNINEKDYDQLLRIKTTTMKEEPNQSIHYNHYEATPYSILNALFNEYVLKKSDGLVDFGCGKGRVMFYVHNRFNCRVTGIEMNEELYLDTLANLANYTRKIKKKSSPIRVERCYAETYNIAETENKFYFFNPFSVQIFRKVVENILLSVEHQQRETDIILYYPSSEYLQYLETDTPFKLVQEVKIPKLYESNNNEHFLIFRIGND